MSDENNEKRPPLPSLPPLPKGLNNGQENPAGKLQDESRAGYASQPTPPNFPQQPVTPPQAPNFNQSPNGYGYQPEQPQTPQQPAAPVYNQAPQQPFNPVPQHPYNPVPQNFNGNQPPVNNPYNQTFQKEQKSNKSLFIVLGSLGLVIVLGIVAFLGVGFVNSMKDPSQVKPAAGTNEPDNGDNGTDNGTPALGDPTLADYYIDAADGTKFYFNVGPDSKWAYTDTSTDATGLKYGLYKVADGSSSCQLLFTGIDAPGISASGDEKAVLDGFMKGFLSSYGADDSAVNDYTEGNMKTFGEGTEAQSMRAYVIPEKKTFVFAGVDLESEVFMNAIIQCGSDDELNEISKSISSGNPEYQFYVDVVRK